MARNFEDILAEVTAKSDPQRKIVLDQVAALPTQQAADEAGLEAKKTQAFDEILGGARRRGLGFSGIPLGEQAKYTATDYAPAVANLKAGYGQRRGTLESALADIGRTDYMTAQDIFARDRAFEESQRQFNEQQRAAAAQNNAFAGLFGGGAGGGQQPTAKMQQRGDKGFNFQGPDGRPISAAQYSQLTGVPFRQLLQEMANAGDAGAKQALGFVGDDYGINAPKVGNNAQVGKLLNDLLWGVNSYRNPLQLAGVNVLSGSGIQTNGNGLRVL